jgi:hypothetical protein
MFIAANRLFAPGEVSAWIWNGRKGDSILTERRGESSGVPAWYHIWLIPTPEAASARPRRSHERRLGNRYHELKTALIFPASSKSRLLIPFTLCVAKSTTTLFHTLNHSGW